MKNARDQFTNLYKKEADAVFRFCILRISDREQAVDLTQEAFLRLWNTLLSETEIKNYRAFLFTIARNLIIDWYRKKKSISLDALTDAEDGGFDFPDDSHEKTTADAEKTQLLRNLNAIDPLLREAVYLRFVEGLSPQEIAKVLHVSVNAASVRISRGIAQLRERRAYGGER
ncbi:MAG: RNA polymerase sigma factor [bacterium]|nr:RNA polymerase sigma factor [bacterium]